VAQLALLVPVAWAHPRAGIDRTPVTIKNTTRVITDTRTLGAPMRPWAPRGSRPPTGRRALTGRRVPSRKHQKTRPRHMCRAAKRKRPNRRKSNRRGSLPCRALLQSARQPSRLQSSPPVHPSRRLQHRPRQRQRPQRRRHRRSPAHRAQRSPAARRMPCETGGTPVATWQRGTQRRPRYRGVQSCPWRWGPQPRPYTLYGRRMHGGQHMARRRAVARRSS
jgi:hypothetical protein